MTKELKEIEDLKAELAVKAEKLEELSKTLDEQVKKRTKELEDSRKALMNILEDVQEAQKKAEEEKNKTLAIIGNFTDGLLVFDKEDKLSLINPQAEIFLKIKIKEVINKSLLELSNFSKIQPLTKLLMKKNKEIFRKELTLKKDLILEVSTVSIEKAKEENETLVILHDITREKTVETMKSDFVSLSAHQLRTPLSGIKWSLNMILEGDFGKITKEQKDILEKAYFTNERMITLVGELLDITRIEEGRFLYKLTGENIVEITEKVIDFLERIAPKQKIKIEFSIEGDIPEVKIDKERISFCIQNLIENAIIYNNPEGKVTILLKYNKTKNQILFSVKDTGVGIPKEEQKKIFTKFFRGTLAIKKETVGSGLGLFVTKNVIEAHKGKIWFESEEGKGSTFYFTLPVK